jgi:REP element-mobilizing transposase RayT
MSLPIAYFLTWRTYGTFLHGDPRGSVGAGHNTPGTPLMPTDPRLEEAERFLMPQPPYVMGTDERAVVDRAIRDHCALRNWAIHALNVRTTHVHIVVSCHGTHSPELAMAQLKSWGTRRLREARLVACDRRLWADHGSTQWINHEAGFIEAVDYVLNRQ